MLPFAAKVQKEMPPLNQKYYGVPAQSLHQTQVRSQISQVDWMQVDFQTWARHALLVHQAPSQQ